MGLPTTSDSRLLIDTHWLRRRLDRGPAVVPPACLHRLLATCRMPNASADFTAVRDGPGLFQQAVNHQCTFRHCTPMAPGQAKCTGGEGRID
jgi:hypothetical protein